MAESDAIHSLGIQLQRGDAATPESFTAIGEIRSVDPPEMSRDMIDVTHHGSVQSWEEVIPGILRSGSITFTINLVPSRTMDQQLAADMSDGTKTNWRLIFPDTSTTRIDFTGYVEQFKTGAEIENQLTADCSIKLTGAPTMFTT